MVKIMNYELDVLAGLVQLKHPNTKKIVEFTGFSERKVQKVIRFLSEDMGIKIKKIKNEKSWYFSIEKWGIFESGRELQLVLKDRNLKPKKEKRIKEKNNNFLMKSFSEKHKYFERVKLKNYRESMRLEGINIVNTPIPHDKAQREKLRNKLLAKYSKKSMSCDTHG